jgi:hypothetical protein
MRPRTSLAPGALFISLAAKIDFAAMQHFMLRRDKS